MSITKKKVFGLIAAIVIMLSAAPITSALANAKDTSSEKETMVSTFDGQPYKLVQGGSSTCCP